MSIIRKISYDHNDVEWSIISDQNYFVIKI